MKNKDQQLLEEAYSMVLKESAVDSLIDRVLSMLDNKGIQYKTEETNYNTGAIKHSVCYSFTINGEEFEIEEFEKTNGKKFVTANIDSNPNEENPSDFAYKSYDHWNMDDFFARVERALT